MQQATGAACGGGSGTRRSGKARPRGRGHRSGRQGAGGSDEKRTGTNASNGGPTSGARESVSRTEKPRRKTGSGGGGGGGGNNRSNDRSRSSRSTTAQSRKLLIRNIPYFVEREQIEALLEAHGVPASLVWRYVSGHTRQNNRPPRATRVYLDLKNASTSELGKQLIAELNGYSFSKDDNAMTKKRGIVVEFAPYQKIPREKPRRDTKMGSIERDPEYLEFLESLAKAAAAPPERSMESLNELVDAAEEKPVAALVQYLNERKTSTRDKGKGKYGKGDRKSERSSRSGRQGRKKDGKDKKKKRKEDLEDDKKAKSSPMRASRRSTSAQSQGQGQTKQVRIMSNREETNSIQQAASAHPEQNEQEKPNKSQRRRDHHHQRSRGGGGSNASGTGTGATSTGGERASGTGGSGGGGSGSSGRRGYKEKDGSRSNRNNSSGTREGGSRKKVFAPKASAPTSS